LSVKTVATRTKITTPWLPTRKNNILRHSKGTRAVIVARTSATTKAYKSTCTTITHRKALQMRNVQQRLQTEWPAYTPCDCRPQGDGTFLWNLQSKCLWSLPSHPAQKETPRSEILFSKILYQRRPTQMRPRAAFFKNRLIKGQIFG
jgi:hypothetical protein